MKRIIVGSLIIALDLYFWIWFFYRSDGNLKWITDSLRLYQAIPETLIFWSGSIALIIYGAKAIKKTKKIKESAK